MHLETILCHQIFCINSSYGMWKTLIELHFWENFHLAIVLQKDVKKAPKKVLNDLKWIWKYSFNFIFKPEKMLILKLQLRCSCPVKYHELTVSLTCQWITKFQRCDSCWSLLQVFLGLIFEEYTKCMKRFGQKNCKEANTHNQIIRVGNLENKWCC